MDLGAPRAHEMARCHLRSGLDLERWSHLLSYQHLRPQWQPFDKTVHLSNLEGGVDANPDNDQNVDASR